MPDFELRYTGTCEQAPPSQIPQLVTLTARRLPVLLGRQPAKGVLVVTGPPDYKKVSRKHVVIGRKADGSLAVIDRGSTFGTYINGTRITQGEEHPLRFCDTLALGDATDGVLQWQLQRPAAVPVAPAEPDAAEVAHPVPPKKRRTRATATRPGAVLAESIVARAGYFTLARAPPAVAEEIRPTWQGQSGVLKSVFGPERGRQIGTAHAGPEGAEASIFAEERRDQITAVVFSQEHQLAEHQRRLRARTQRQRYNNNFHIDPCDATGTKHMLFSEFDPDAVLTPRQRRLLGVDDETKTHDRDARGWPLRRPGAPPVADSDPQFLAPPRQQPQQEKQQQQREGPKVQHIGKDLEGEVCGLLFEVSKMQETDVKQGSWTKAWSGMLHERMTHTGGHAHTQAAEPAAAATGGTEDTGGDGGAPSQTQYFCVLTHEALVMRDVSKLCGMRRGCMCKTRRIEVSEMEVVRSARDQKEARGFSLDCAFIIRDTHEDTHVFAAESIAERRAWLQCLTELRMPTLIKQSQCAVSAQWLLNFIRGDKSPYARKLAALRKITPVDIRVIKGPFLCEAKDEHDFEEGSWITQIQLAGGRYVWATTPPARNAPTVQDLIDTWLLGSGGGSSRKVPYIKSTRCLWDMVVYSSLYGVSSEPAQQLEEATPNAPTGPSDGSSSAPNSSPSTYIPAESYVPQSQQVRSYVEQILSTNSRVLERGILGQANLFVSQSSASDALGLASAIEEHCRSSHLEPRDVYVWLDALSMRLEPSLRCEKQHAMIKKLIGQCGHVLAVISPWQSPMSLRWQKLRENYVHSLDASQARGAATLGWMGRLWCITEGWFAIKERAKLSVGMPLREIQTFQRALIDDPGALLDTNLTVNIKQTKSFDKEHKAMMMRYFEKMDANDASRGFNLANTAIRQQLLEWMLDNGMLLMQSVHEKKESERTETDCRLLLSYCTLLVEAGRPEAQTVCTAGIRLVSGLVTQLGRDGRPTGHFENADVLALLTSLHNCLHKENHQQQGDPKLLQQQAVQILKATGRTVCEAHYCADGSGEAKSKDARKAVVVGTVLSPFQASRSFHLGSSGIAMYLQNHSVKKLRVVYETGDVATVPTDWVGKQWQHDPVLKQPAGLLGEIHEVALRLKQRLTVPSDVQIHSKVLTMRDVVSTWLHHYPDHPRTLEALGRLARLLAGEDSTVSAEDEQITSPSPSPPPPSSGGGGGGGDGKLKLLEEAEHIFAQLLPTMEAKLGLKHRVTIGALAEFGAVLMQATDLSELLGSLQEVDDEQMRETHYRMDEAQRRQWIEKQTAHARPVLKVHSDVLERYRSLYGNDHVRTLTARYRLACTCEALLLEGEARRILEEVLQISTVHLGEHHQLSRDAKAALARCDVLRLFKELDADGSGELGEEEIRALGRWRKPGAPELTEEELGVAMAEMDPSGDGLVDATEFSAWWANQLAGGGGLLGEACANAGQIIGAVQKERAGPQTAAEKLEAALAATRARIAAKKNAAGENLSVKLTAKRLEKQARRLFTSVDDDGSGLLDADEVQLLAKKLGLEMTQEDAQQAMETMDTDASGEVDFTEFFCWFKKTVMDVAREEEEDEDDEQQHERGAGTAGAAGAAAGAGPSAAAGAAPSPTVVDSSAVGGTAAAASTARKDEVSRWTDGQRTWRVLADHSIQDWDARAKHWRRHSGGGGGGGGEL